MTSRVDFAGRLGLVLVLLGGTGFAGGSVMEAQYDCVSGTDLAIERVPDPNTTDVQGNTTAFSELSPVEQRIFLEAYTSSSDNRRYGKTYPNWSADWFDRNQSIGPYYVEYRNEYWELEFFATDCGLSGGPFIRIGGTLGLILGGILLAIAGISKLRQTSH